MKIIKLIIFIITLVFTASLKRSAIEKYINLKAHKLEIDRKLEQMRALDNQMKIEVGFIPIDIPLSVDTEEDLR